MQILGSRKLKNNGLGVFACETKEDLFKFINFYYKIGSINIDETVVIEFETDIVFEESYDHDPKFFGNTKAVVCWGEDVPISNFKLLRIE
jgi:hypothetical protein